MAERDHDIVVGSREGKGFWCLSQYLKNRLMCITSIIAFVVVGGSIYPHLGTKVLSNVQRPVSIYPTHTHNTAAETEVPFLGVYTHLLAREACSFPRTRFGRIEASEKKDRTWFTPAAIPI